jgi:hypothetical protein
MKMTAFCDIALYIIAEDEREHSEDQGVDGRMGLE